MESKDINGKVVLITGAAGGIGSATARLLGKKGARLVLADRNRRGAEALASELGAAHMAVACDISKPAEVGEMVRKALKRYGRIDILVNNAGIITPNLFEKCTRAEIRKQIDVNLMGPLICTREVVPVMKAQGGGGIVSISSLAGIVPETYSSIYCAAKFALRGFSLTLRLELRRWNITVSAIFPDSVATPMLKHELEHGGSPLTFLGRPQGPDRVANAVLRAILTKKAEICVPGSTGVFSRLVMVFPGLVTLVWPLLEKIGQKNKDRIQKGGFY